MTNIPASATQFYINGAWVEPHGSGRMGITNPATAQDFSTVALADEVDVDRAVAAARAAFAAYSQTSRAERLALLARIIEIYERRMADISEAVLQELGAPRDFAHNTQAWIGLAHLQRAHEELEKYEFHRTRGTTRIVREAAGVAALITPWNWPLNQIAVKVGPALATGCTMVLKPSELTPLNAVIFTEILHEAGVPPGVFNLIQGEGPLAGRALAGHPDIDVVSFTGSTRAGIDIARTAAPTVKRVLQELGGKSPFIVLPDADLPKAVAGCAAIVFGNSGQSCDSPTRLLVPRAALAEAETLAVEQANAVVVGHPNHPATTMGPLVSERQWNHVQRLIQSAVDEGAALLAGGPGKPAGLSAGYFVQPTVFSNVNLQMTAANEEIFGPVITLIPYDSVQEAIEIGNNTPYGLAGYVHGKDMHAVRAVAAQLRAGSIMLNDPPLDLGAPFGGYKQSGNGREYAEYGFDDFTEIKSIVGYGGEDAVC